VGSPPLTRYNLLMARTKNGRRIAFLSGVVVVAAVTGFVWVSWDEIRAWYLFWREFESLGVNAQGYPEYRHHKSGIVFVWLPGGEFYMGSPEASSETDEGPIHKVTLSAFLVAKYEVTHAEWKKVAGNNPSGFKGDALSVHVSWEDCLAFCEKLGFSLPTEAQWEYACRAGTTGPFAGTAKLDDMGWYIDNSEERPHPVGEKRPNDFGLYDMHGNVWEWCEDVYDENFYSKPEARKRNPLCTSGSEKRVTRGGSTYSSREGCRSAYRRRGVHNIYVGFRPAWSWP